MKPRVMANLHTQQQLTNSISKTINDTTDKPLEYPQPCANYQPTPSSTFPSPSHRRHPHAHPFHFCNDVELSTTGTRRSPKSESPRDVRRNHFSNSNVFHLPSPSPSPSSISIPISIPISLILSINKAALRAAPFQLPSSNAINQMTTSPSLFYIAN